MKIYKSGYRSHWFSPYKIIEYAFFWTDWSRCSRSRGIVEDSAFVDHPAWVDRAVDYLSPISRAIQWILDLVHPQINYVKIDYYDTWSFDHTLADIILPGLKQLKETKHGAPFTEDSDVPEYLRSYMAQPKENEWDTDSLHFMRWDWILDEMIWAFEQKVSDDAESQFFDHSAYEKDKVPVRDWLADMENRVNKTKYDKEGHEAWLKRKANGFRLFGKYYENLWD
jgi:hypothetical protein